VTSDRVARDYLRRAEARRLMLETLWGAGVHADVVRESQDVVELVLKGRYGSWASIRPSAMTCMA